MKTLTIAIPLLVGLAFAMPIQADHGCNGTVIRVDVGTETVYVDDRSSLSGDHIDLWFYLENNGVPGLQSGGHNSPFVDEEFPFQTDYLCHHDTSDRLLLHLSP